MTEIKKSSDVYGGSLGLHTTVNMGLRLLKPVAGLAAIHKDWVMRLQHLPPIGSLGLPVTNCKKSRLSGGDSSLIV